MSCARLFLKYKETNVINKFNLLHNPIEADAYYYAYFIDKVNETP